MDDDGLREVLGAGRVVYTLLRHESASKKTAWFDVVVAEERDSVYTWTYCVGKRLGLTHHAVHGLEMPGGRHMAHELVKRLGAALYGDENAFTWREL